jgi:3'-phosphoadenosine 5'-phosphosulfate sulfotransferase (PAPS reductase)/FAD synthetase
MTPATTLSTPRPHQLSLIPPPAELVPDLPWYDFILLNTSAGKDSQTMIHRVYHLARAAGISDRLVAVHSDLGRVEWSGTKQLAREQAAHYGIRFEVVKRNGGDLLEYIEARGKFPGPGPARYCTSDFKRSPIRVLMTALADEFHGGPHNGPNKRYRGRPCRILNCLGLRSDESPKREQRLQFQLDHQNSRRHVDEWSPIKHWTTAEVWDSIHRSGVPYHPAYDLGMPRLSCVFCIFAPRPALLIAGQHNAQLLAEYVAVEQRIGHRFRLNQPLIEIQTALAAGEIPGPVTRWAQCA